MNLLWKLDDQLPSFEPLGRLSASRLNFVSRLVLSHLFIAFYSLSYALQVALDHSIILAGCGRALTAKSGFIPSVLVVLEDQIQHQKGQADPYTDSDCNLGAG